MNGSMQRIGSALVDVAFFVVVGFLGFKGVLHEALLGVIFTGYAAGRFGVAMNKQTVLAASGSSPTQPPPPPAASGGSGGGGRTETTTTTTSQRSALPHTSPLVLFGQWVLRDGVRMFVVLALGTLALILQLAFTLPMRGAAPALLAVVTAVAMMRLVRTYRSVVRDRRSSTPSFAP